jgi:hypothetical protein
VVVLRINILAFHVSLDMLLIDRYTYPDLVFQVLWKHLLKTSINPETSLDGAPRAFAFEVYVQLMLGMMP